MWSRKSEAELVFELIAHKWSYDFYSKHLVDFTCKWKVLYLQFLL